MSLWPGRRLSHYRVLERIGAGGMGVVFRARDENLERDVAIKVLPAGLLTNESAQSRFRREALALSKLNHPNIAAVYDFGSENGTDFLVMELVPGKTLAEHLRSGPLPESEVLELGRQLAEGLSAAHRQGIVHRDLKPANLHITPEGRLKILDFGLAKMVRKATEEAHTATQTQGVVGTFAYMAPEQLREGPVDQRTDVYGAGAVLYEMAAGERCFDHNDTASLLYAITQGEPRKLRESHAKVSAALEAVILKCLEKDPARRYTSADQLGQDLERIGAGLRVTARRRLRQPSSLVLRASLGLGAVLAVVAGILLGTNAGSIRTRLVGGGDVPRITSLALLPLQNLSGDPRQDYFVDGMTDALITELGKLKALRVISRQSTMKLKNTTKPLPEITRELHVDALVMGSVVLADGRVRIIAQLVLPDPERQIWGESYDRQVRDVLSVHSEISKAIARQVGLELTPEEKEDLAKSRPVDPAAYQEYLQARYFLNLATETSARTSIEHLERSIAKDPNFAPAYAGLVLAYDMLTQGAAVPMSTHLDKMKEAAARALALDDRLADGYVALGNIRIFYDWDFGAAGEEYRRAIELNPGCADGYLALSQLLNVLGRHDEALATILHGRDLDPLNPFLQCNVPFRYIYAGQSDKAIEESERLEKAYPEIYRRHWILHWGRGCAHLKKHRYGDAARALEKAVDLSGGVIEAVPDLAYAYARGGRTDKAKGLLRRLEDENRTRHVPSYFLAMIHAALGDKDEAFRRADESLEERDYRLLGLAILPGSEALRGDPRWEPLLRRIGIPDAFVPER